MKVPDLYCGKRLFVGEGNPEALGRGDSEIRGSSYIEGPLQVGNPSAFSSVEATVMIGSETNSDNPSTPDTSLMVSGDTQVKDGVLKHTNGIDCHFANSTINIQSWKGFDIKHPTNPGYRLRHICLEGPEGGVYTRGRVTNQKEIELPQYWTELVDPKSITVSLTPIGSHQDVIVKRIGENKVFLQSRGGMPIDCFYHIFGERIDGEKLIVEYKGETPADYPGDSSQYSISGYDYGAKGVDRAD